MEYLGDRDFWDDDQIEVLDRTEQVPDDSDNDDEEVGYCYVGDRRVSSRFGSEESNAGLIEMMKRGDELEEMALGKRAKEVKDRNDGDGPKKMKDFPTQIALEFICKLEEAREMKDGNLMSDLVYDADCENLGNEIDLEWYE